MSPRFPRDDDAFLPARAMELHSLLMNAFDRRRGLFGRADCDCFRLFNSDGDGAGGLTIDRYGGYALVQFFNGKAETMVMQNGDVIERALASLPVDIIGIVVKDRKKEGGNADIAESRRSVMLRGEPPSGEYTVRQNGLTVRADLMKGQSTGVFLDMREVRDALVAMYPEGGRMLNLFCYTALFSVHALRHGMGHSLNVDLSAAVLRRARDNFVLNGLPADARDFVRGDALDWLGRLGRKGAAFSFAVIDPPTFARHRRRSFSVRRHLPRALGALAPLVPGGTVLSAVNSHGVDYGEYRSLHPRGWRLEWYGNESSDFVRHGDPYLKVGLWKTGS